MKLLVIGSGGREHAIAWKLAQSPKVQKVFVAPGNGGTARENGLENVAISEVADLVAFAKRESVYLTVVGPEAALAAGVVDAFRDAGLKIFGPTRAAAQLESSKDFAKAFMRVVATCFGRTLWRLRSASRAVAKSRSSSASSARVAREALCMRSPCASARSIQRSRR